MPYRFKQQTLLYGLIASVFLMRSPLVAAHIPVAYHMVAERYQIPINILYAVALTESRKSYQTTVLPYPWALNVAGESVYCINQRECIARSQQAIQAGQSFDIGVMQVSWYWHKHRFTSLIEAWHPQNNLAVGAQILREQYDKTGDWWLAVGDYHAPSNPARAMAYRARVKAQWERLQ